MITAVRRVIRDESASILRRESPFDATRHLQVLTPRNGGPLGVEALNAALRPVLNRNTTDGPWIAGAQRARVGDRVTCIENDYTVEPEGVMNGEQGIVTAIDGDTLHLLLDDGRRVATRGVQHKSLALAFAAAVHRAQGSEYPVVVLVYHRAHGALLDQRLLYTAVTRAREHLVLCTDDGAVAESAAQDAARHRISGLAERIRRAHDARRAHRSAAGGTGKPAAVAGGNAR